MKTKRQYNQLRQTKWLMVMIMLIGFLAILPLVSAGTYIYQENANSTGCNADWAGGYECVKTYDESWTTFGASAGTGYVYENYTKIPTATYAILQMKINASAAFNRTIPNTCYNYDATKIIIRGYSATNCGYECYNGGWVTIQDSGGGNNLYEDAMIWNMTANSTASCNFTYNGVNNALSCSTYNITITAPPSSSYGILGATNYLNYTDNFGITNYSVAFTQAIPRTLLFYNQTILTWNWGYILFENSQTFNAIVYETSNENFNLNITYNSSAYTGITANLIYNGTSYAGTSSGTGSTRNFSRTIPIPSISIQTNKSFYWNIGLTNATGTFYYNSTFKNQTINPISFELCTPALNKTYINFTFKDESTGNYLNASMDLATWTYSMGTATKSLIISNSSENSYYAFCFSPSDKTITSTLTFQYASTGYPQRKYINYFTLTNGTTNKTLYLLSSTDGLYVTFQLINAADQSLAGVNVNATREILGTTEVLGLGTTGADGGITLWLNPDYVHTASFFLFPYPLYQVTQAFTQASYTITLGSAGTANVSDYTKGISYSVKPTDSWLNNGTAYSFNFTISSTYWGLDSYGFNITNENGILIASNSDTASGGGTINSLINTEGNQTFYMTYYWIVNGTITQATRSWQILDLSGSSFSINNFLTDFKAYIATGFFGLDNFGLGIIIFVIILVVTGTLKLKHGITDEATLIGVIFSLVALFDVGFSLIPNPIGAVPHFPTIVMALVFMGFLYKEVFT